MCQKLAENEDEMGFRLTETRDKDISLYIFTCFRNQDQCLRSFRRDLVFLCLVFCNVDVNISNEYNVDKIR